MGVFPSNVGLLFRPERRQWVIYGCDNHHEAMVAQGEKVPRQCPLCNEAMRPVGGIEEIELNTIAGPVVVRVGVHERHPPRLEIKLAD